MGFGAGAAPTSEDAACVAGAGAGSFGFAFGAASAPRVAAAELVMTVDAASADFRSSGLLLGAAVDASDAEPSGLGAEDFGPPWAKRPLRAPAAEEVMADWFSTDLAPDDFFGGGASVAVAVVPGSEELVAGGSVLVGGAFGAPCARRPPKAPAAEEVMEDWFSTDFAPDAFFAGGGVEEASSADSGTVLAGGGLLAPGFSSPPRAPAAEDVMAVDWFRTDFAPDDFFGSGSVLAEASGASVASGGLVDGEDFARRLPRAPAAEDDMTVDCAKTDFALLDCVGFASTVAGSSSSWTVDRAAWPLDASVAGLPSFLAKRAPRLLAAEDVIAVEGARQLLASPGRVFFDAAASASNVVATSDTMRPSLPWGVSDGISARGILAGIGSLAADATKSEKSSPGSRDCILLG